ncbi:hypothetical protein P280DRAFT_461762 [Massarina eburnea CBS 473.64]|uniref:RGS domain-containing protein n=1 Tax=Massarina eburnea CBS 473.64 TaxID=1395130 RepID=A0A6A6RK31_9PLEO|nr:hypothetical protein P280DRAFT_461762 [Massarina eburnea CBS 473.64]
MASAVLDRIGWTYMVIAIVWTVALACGMLFLYQHRQLPCIRIRHLPLLFIGVISLHLYGFICGIAYVIGPILPCSGEFWMMSIYVPFGIAFFQAANSQFYYLASRQKQYANLSSLSRHESLPEERAKRLANSRWRRMFGGVRNANGIDQTLIYIGIGLVIQLLLSLFVFFASKKFHPSYGLWGWNVQDAEVATRVNCSRGWEWWLSIVWQFFWAWIYAPYLLWKSRGIKDVHGWRLQTICCCLAGLPATPLWLAGLYLPQMAPVDAYFMPPTWFSISIFFMEVTTIGFPIAQIFKNNALRRETLAAVDAWEKRRQCDSSSSSTVVGSEYSLQTTESTQKGFHTTEISPSGRSSPNSQKSDMLTMVALEKALRTDPIPLLEFAALKDFSGENISFLTHLADWRREWMLPKPSVTEHRRSRFLAATRIYAHFVSMDHSEFPINISSREMKVLHRIFESAATLLFRNRSMASSTDSATPFDNALSDSDSTTDLKLVVNLHALGRANLRSVSRMLEFREEALSTIVIPEAFTEMVFDDAESEIKYLVLTNTWPKFVTAGLETKEHDVERQQAGWFGRVLCSA